ncbi:MAG: hypothetical protein AVDCRST_MAG68-2862 [uncultured Gemmatimonadetes bacterium]|uniref:Uncharacterized protein n=1 Tax=uncultured Gemmatimonadota bacterium TaxID=203437 RepID=A0A6J4LR00_9BACT|nr:MAG: hypothetical protein AVDCRST_MAG68-2862 [uncultured Gemmatimonadota bacterium]
MSDAINPSALQFDYAEPAGAAAQLSCAACSAPLSGVYHKINDKTTCSRCRAAVESEAGRGGFAKALAFGIGAAVAGFVVYYAIAKVTGYELSLISILVGFMVGRAVSEGSGGRGGKRYQALAMGLTYLSITATYIPMIMAQATGEVAGSGTAVLLAFSEVLALAMPFLMATENPITLLIIGFGLYQAWQMNARRQLDISGPYNVAPAVG